MICFNSNSTGKVLLTLSIIFFSTLIHGQIVNIPDANFKAELLQNSVRDISGTWIPSTDLNENGEIEVSEAENISSLDVRYASITSMEGIENFTNLEELYCSQNQITSLNVQNLTNLEILNCSENILTNLNINGLINLQNLRCSYNELTSLNLSNSTNLILLQCHNNQLSSLDIQNLINLESLTSSYNPIISLDVQNSTNLKILQCVNNQLADLNVQGLTNLEILDCGDNPLGDLNLQGLNALRYLYCTNTGLSSIDLQGLYLKLLSCAENQLTSLDIQGQSGLENLSCSSNQLTSLNLLNLTDLISINCTDNQITSLTIVNQPQLYSLYCSSNQLTSINFGNSGSGIRTLSCSNNNLSTLNLQNLFQLEYLYCSSNNLSTLDLSDCDLRRLACDSNSISSLDLSGQIDLRELYCKDNNITSLDLQNQVDLQQLVCSDNKLISLYIKNNIVEDSLNIDNNPDLVYICTDDAQVQEVQALVNEANYTNCIVNSYCSFTPSDYFNTIQGALILDENENGCDSNDNGVPIKIYINDGVDDGYIFPNETYISYVEEGNYTLTPILENPYFTITPESVEINFANDTNNIVIQDFCVSPNGEFNDLEVTLIPTDDARPGFDAHYDLIYENKGTTTLSGSVTLSFFDNVLDFVDTSLPFNNQNSGTLSWDFSNLPPFGSQTISITFNVNSPTEAPSVEINDSLFFSSTIQSNTTDETPEDNYSEFNQIVVGSYDPNDKTCLEGETLPIDKIGEYLHYLIRFENTGNYLAENVVVRDIIDIAKFDINSLEPVGSSHSMRMNIEGNTVEFIFTGINLPFQDDLNDGYLTFKIKTLDNLIIGDDITNKANIFFDFNPPITTNETITQVSSPTNINTPNEILGIEVFPNPTHEILYLKTDLNIIGVVFYDTLGRIIKNKALQEKQVNISSFPQGVYFIKVKTDAGDSILKIIKK